MIIFIMEIAMPVQTIFTVKCQALGPFQYDKVVLLVQEISAEVSRPQTTQTVTLIDQCREDDSVGLSQS